MHTLHSHVYTEGYECAYLCVVAIQPDNDRIRENRTKIHPRVYISTEGRTTAQSKLPDEQFKNTSKGPCQVILSNAEYLSSYMYKEYIRSMIYHSATYMLWWVRQGL